jgi:hypothetical protein
MQAELLELLRKHTDDIAVAALAGKEVGGAIDGDESLFFVGLCFNRVMWNTELRTLVESMAVEVFDAEKFKSTTPEARRVAMRKKKQLLTELRTILGRIQGVFLLKTSTSTSVTQGGRSTLHVFHAYAKSNVVILICY